MKIGKYTLILCSILGALGLLFFFFAALSPAAASAPTITEHVPSSKLVDPGWRILADMHSGRGDPGVTSFDNKMYVMSGYFSPGYDYSSSLEVYDPLSNTWEQLWGFPAPRSDMVVKTVGDKIYAIGGWNLDRGGVQGNTNRYDPATGTWITMTSMITPVSAAAGIVLSDTIYVIGGFDGVDAINQVQIFDPATDQWFIGTPMAQPRVAFEAVLLDGLVYVLGGTLNTNNVEIFNPTTNEWSSGPSLPDTRYSMAAVNLQDKIYVIGGTDEPAGESYTDTVFVYDPVSSVWSSLDDPLPTARRAAGSAVISDTIYVVGGDGEYGAGKANEGYGVFDVLSTTTRIVEDEPDPSQVLQPFVVSYQVSSTFDLPTGVVTVTIDQNTAECHGQLIDGAGSCDITLDTPGTYTITATYGGDMYHESSSDTAVHTVIEAAVLPKIYLPSILH